MEGSKLIPATLSKINFSSIPASTYFLVGPIYQPARILMVQNLTDVGLMFSFDGITPHFVLPAGGFLLLDAGTNKGTPCTSSIPSGYSIFVTSVDGFLLPSIGIVTMSFWYAA